MLQDRVTGSSNHSPLLFFFCGGKKAKQPFLSVWIPAAAAEEDGKKILHHSVLIGAVKEVTS